MVSGDQVGDYVLVDCLGEGGQGVVWRARPQHADDIFVALKMLRPWAEQDTDSVRRLREDAKAIARMKHPNIIKVHFFGQDRGRWYFAMELMEGGRSRGGSTTIGTTRGPPPCSSRRWPGPSTTPTPATRESSTSISSPATSSWTRTASRG